MNRELLNDKVSASGLKKNHLAKVLGLSRQGLKNKLDGTSDWTRIEIVMLCNALGISDPAERDAIFFGPYVD